MDLHFKLEPGSRIVQPVPKEYNVFAYVIHGKGIFEPSDSNKVERENLVIFYTDGNEVYIQ
jgi:quercetin 2,3-dioxygenase